MKKICLLLALLMCVSVFSACTNDKNDDTLNGSEETEREIVRVALSEFTLVRPEKFVKLENSDKDLVDVAKEFRTALNEAIGGTIEFKSDFYVGELEYYGREILFGETNRPESKRAYEDLGDVYKYIIRDDGEHIVIAAKPEYLEEAAEAFITNLVSGADVLFGTRIETKIEYQITDLTINGVDIGEYSLVISTQMSSEEQEDIKWLAENILDSTGKSLSIVTDDKAKGEHEIVIGEARGQKYSGFDTLDFVKKTDGKHLYLGGTNYWANIKAIYSFLREDLGIDFEGKCSKQEIALNNMDVVDRYETPAVELAATCNMGWGFNGSEEMVAEVAEAGMTRITVSLDHVSKKQTLREFLQYVTYYEIRVLWMEDSVKAVVVNDYDTLNAPYWKSRHECPMTIGCYIWDEPSTGDFDNVAQAVLGYRTATGKVAFTNLLPAYAPSSHFGGLTYEQHVRTFVEKVQPTELWVDIYPFFEYTTWEGYVDNVSLVSQIAREEGIPFGIYIQACPYSDRRTPTYADYSVQLYTSLSFGATMIEYFTYTTVPSNLENFGEAIIDASGERTARYDMVKELNAHISSFAEVYGEYNSLGAFSVNCKPGTYAYHSNQYNGFDSVVSLDTDDSVLVGCFEKAGGKKAFTLVNLNDLVTGESASIRVKAGQSLTVYQQGECKTLTADSEGYVNITLQKGEGVFVVIN